MQTKNKYVPVSKGFENLNIDNVITVYGKRKLLQQVVPSLSSVFI